MPAVPNRSTDLSRERNANRSDRTPLKKGEAFPSVIPDPDPNWHRVAKMIWNSLEDSGQSQFYQQSDWAIAYALCDEMSEYKLAHGKAKSAMKLQIIMQGLGDLLVTEADRRRARIELEEPDDGKQEAASVTVMADYEKALKAN